MSEQDHIVILREMAAIVMKPVTTVKMLEGLIDVIHRRMNMVSGSFIMRHSAFWSAERMLGFDFKSGSGRLGVFRLTGVFDGEIGRIMTAEILSEQDFAARVPSRELHWESRGGVTTLRVPLHYRQRFIGFFEIVRRDEGATLSNAWVAAFLEVVGTVVADVSETRTHQRYERERLIETNRRLQTQIEPPLKNFIGESACMKEVYTLVRQVAPTDATVLIRGKSGTGKELVARSIVSLSPRHDRPFLVVNCAALPEALIESELFGHEKGAFTGALERRIGRAEAADGGTLFLDEVGDLSVATQVKLLRFLQERTFSRVGSNEVRKANVRFIAATSRNLEELIERKLFREDLYYRLNVFAIPMPDLAARQSDIVLLARHFLEKFSARYNKDVHDIAPEVLAALMDYGWPGNVRELENCMERAVLSATDSVIRLRCLPAALRPGAGSEPNAAAGALPSLESDDRPLRARLADYEKTLIDAAIAQSNGNLSAAARALGISPRMMYYKTRSGARKTAK